MHYMRFTQFVKFYAPSFYWDSLPKYMAVVNNRQLSKITVQASFLPPGSKLKSNVSPFAVISKFMNFHTLITPQEPALLAASVLLDLCTPSMGMNLWGESPL